MMKSLAVVAAIAFVGVQASDGVKRRKDKAGCQGKRCLNDEMLEGLFDKTEPQANDEGRRLSKGAVDVKRNQECRGRRCLNDEMLKGMFDKTEPQDNDFGRRLGGAQRRGKDDDGRRLFGQTAEESNDAMIDGGRRLAFEPLHPELNGGEFEEDFNEMENPNNFSQNCRGKRCLADEFEGRFDKAEREDIQYDEEYEEGEDRRLLRRGGHSGRNGGRRHHWNRNEGVLMGCNFDQLTDSDIFGRVGLYHPNQIEDGETEGVQMRGFFSNLSDEYGDDFYVQVVSAATGEEHVFASFMAEDSRWFAEIKKGGFFYGSDESDDQMCLGSNCPAETSYLNVQVGDSIQLFADLGTDSNSPLGQCTLEIKEPCHDNDGDSSDEESADEESDDEETADEDDDDSPM